MDRKKSLLKNTFVLAIGMLLPKVCSYLVLPILTLNIDSADYGTYDLFITIVAFILPITTLQIQSAAFRYIIDARENRSDQVSLITNSIVFVLSTTTITIILWMIASPIQLRLRLYMGCYYLLDVLFNTLSQIARGLGKNRDYTIFSASRSIMMLAMVYITVSVLNMGIDGLYISLCVAFAVSTLILIYRIKLFRLIALSATSTIELKRMLKYSVPLIPNAISLLILSSSDRVVIASFLGVDANAQYAIASKFPAILSSIVSVFTASWAESATLENSKKDTALFYNNVHSAYTKILSSATLLLMTVTPFVFNLLIQGNYTGGFTQIPWIYIGVFLSGINAFYGAIYLADKKVNNVMKTTLFATIVNLIVDLMFIKWIGLYAASISTILSYLTVILLRRRELKRSYTLNISVRTTLSIVALLPISIIVYYYPNWIVRWVALAITVVAVAMICRNEICGLLRKARK